MVEMFNEFGKSTAGRLVFAAIALLCMFAMAGLMSRNKKFSTKQLTYIAVSLALSTALSFITLFKMPMGGSVTPGSMFFVMLPSFWFGPGIGLLAGITHGLIQLAIEPQIYHPIQVLLDYQIAFGMLGLLPGLIMKVSRKPMIGMILGAIGGVFGRFVMSTISGVVFFAEFAPEGMHPLAYSAGYNGGYNGVELIIIILFLCVPVFVQAVELVGKRARA